MVMAPASGNITRRWTRATSSRAGSEDATSVASEGLTTPAPRRRLRSTPAKEAVQTGRDVGNRGSTAYGAKGKAYSATKLSLEDAQRDPQELLNAAVDQARKDRGTSARQAGLAPVLEEQPVTQRSQSPAREQNQTSDTGRDVPTNRPATSPRPGNVHEPATARDGVIVHRGYLQRTQARIFAWFASEKRPALANSGANADFSAHWDSFHEDVLARERHRSFLLYGMMVVVGILSIAMSMFYHGLGGASLIASTFTGARSNLTSGGNDNAFVLGLNHRLSKLERTVGHLSDRPSPSDTTPGTYQSYAQVDWFSAANGAVVIPYFTSPPHMHFCKKAPLTLPQYIRTSIFGAVAYCDSDSGSTALKPWTEVDERFCAPPNRGKLQIGVITPRVIAPSTLVIEHPKDALIEKGETPKNLELWIDIADEAVRGDLKSSLGDLNPDQSFTYTPQTERELPIDKSLPPTFVLVGRWNYDLYDPQYIQSFPIRFDLQALGVKANRFAVRINSNWGDATATCLYRVRLLGKDMSGLKEKLEGSVLD